MHLALGGPLPRGQGCGLHVHYLRVNKYMPGKDGTERELRRFLLGLAAADPAPIDLVLLNFGLHHMVAWNDRILGAPVLRPLPFGQMLYNGGPTPSHYSLPLDDLCISPYFPKLNCRCAIATQVHAICGKWHCFCKLHCFCLGCRPLCAKGTYCHGGGVHVHLDKSAPK